MSTPVVKFNKKDRPEFFRVLRVRVNDYFSHNKISKHADANMILKTLFMLAVYIIPLILMISGVTNTLWSMLLMWTIMGFGMSGIGLAVMHDANHGSYSKNQTVNAILGFMINITGGYHINWKIQHNVLHHSFTNVHDFDEDIDKPPMRFSPNQKNKFIFRFQAYYALFLYGLITLNWVLVKDLNLLLRYHRKDLLKGQGRTFLGALLEIVFHKIWYVAIVLILPIMVLDIPWWQICLGFLLMHFISGLILALIFQCAHVLEETEFYKTDENSSVENSWAIHQMHTTSNFANDSRIFSWLVGGLNYQVEHHLFPNICHVHYRGISKIVKETAAEFNVPYLQHRTFWGAIKSHFTLLHQLGTGTHASDLAKKVA